MGNAVHEFMLQRFVEEVNISTDAFISMCTNEFMLQHFVVDMNPSIGHHLHAISSIGLSVECSVKDVTVSTVCVIICKEFMMQTTVEEVNTKKRHVHIHAYHPSIPCIRCIQLLFISLCCKDVLKR